jgi:hypothetical protein
MSVEKVVEIRGKKREYLEYKINYLERNCKDTNDKNK